MVKVSSYPSPLVPLPILRFHPLIHEITTKEILFYSYTTVLKIRDTHHLIILSAP